MDFPDSPEAVALALLDRILERDKDAQAKVTRGDNRTKTAALLDLYADCLAAATGRRDAAATATYH
jgi:hypothetical protein